MKTTGRNLNRRQALGVIAASAASCGFPSTILAAGEPRRRKMLLSFYCDDTSPFVLHASGAESAAPIPPPPQDRSLLPAPRDAVVMVQTVHGRLNVSLGGWGGQRLIQAKTDPEKFRGYVRAVKDRGLNCVRPLFHPPNAAKANDANWAPFDWEAMDRAVAITQEEGVYFLVDYHNWLVNDTIHAHEQEWLQAWGWLVSRY